MRIKCIILEYHGNITVLWLHIIHADTVDQKISTTDFFQPGYHTKGG